MEKLIIEDVENIKDPAVKSAIIQILDAHNRILSLPATTEDPKSLAATVNKITGKL